MLEIGPQLQAVAWGTTLDSAQASLVDHVMLGVKLGELYETQVP